MNRKLSNNRPTSDGQDKQKAQEKVDADRKQLLESLQQFSKRAIKIQNACVNEEQTKASLVSPYIDQLGYDASDPFTVCREYTADIGKKGEKVDYAILRDESPSILIEAKPAGTHFASKKAPAQLLRYFMAAEADFAALTNGLEWHWFRAIPGNIKLESEPFLSLDVRKPLPYQLDWLLQVSEPYFDLEKTRIQAELQLVTSKSLEWIESERKGPTDKFIRFFIREQELGRASPHMVNTAQNVFRRVFNNYINQEADVLLAKARNFAEEELNIVVERKKKIIKTASGSRKKPASAKEVFLDTEDGQPMMSSFDRPRAWRLPEKEKFWIRENHSKDLQLAVIHHLAGRDIRGIKKFFNESLDGVTFKGKNAEIDIKRHTEIIPGVWHETALSNIKRKTVLTTVANLVRTSDGRSISVSEDPDADVQVWLPTGKK